MRADGSEILVELAITAFRLGAEPVFAAYLRDVTVRSLGRRMSSDLTGKDGEDVQLTPVGKASSPPPIAS